MLNRLTEVFKSFQKNDVKYLVIGGIAAVLHGVPRATFGLDVLIEATPDNAERLLAAMTEAGLFTATLTNPQAVLGHEISIFKDRVRIDVQTSTPGITFEAAWPRKETMTYEDQPFFVVSRDDLIAAKKAASRKVPAEKVAREIDAYVKAMKKVFPDMAAGDTEPLLKTVRVKDLQRWLATYAAVTGSPLPFLHLDVDFTRHGWAKDAKELERFARAQGVQFGIIYCGSWFDRSDQAWLANAGERVKEYELTSGGRPDHVLFQSWHDRPDRCLPETKPDTFTNFIKAYFEDRSTIGFRMTGPGANLALKKRLKASKSLPVNPPALAADGSSETWWSAGDFAPQSLVIDLGAPSVVAAIRLRVSQSPAGRTIHRLYGSKAGRGERFTLLYTFEGITNDLDELAYVPPEPLRDLQSIRIETVESPSWVGWREIEAIAGE